MILPRPLLALPAALALLGLAACSAASPPPASTAPAADAAPDADGHGRIAGAAEVAEPPLGLLSVDADGNAGLLDLLDGATSELGRVGSPLALASDGRFAFVSTRAGLEILDSGRWTWDHVDHFHYYRAEPRPVGTVPGGGAATVVAGPLSTAGTTGVFFPGSGEAVLLDNGALAEGRVSERFRIDTGEDRGLVAPLGDAALLAAGGELTHLSPDGEPAGASAACTAPSGAITTRVGVVVGCAEGAVLATAGASGGAPRLETIPYPDAGGAERATEFAGRKGRPTVAGLAGGAGGSGFWLLDTRERSWRHVPSGTPLARIAAVDDADAHVVAVDTTGRVRVFDGGTGRELGATEPLVAEVTPEVALSVDEQRAYVNDPEGGVVHEIAYAGEVRVARTLETPTAPRLVAEVGR